MATGSTKEPQFFCCCDKLKNYKHYTRRDLSCCFGALYSRADANLILAECESSLQYVSGELSKVKVFGKKHDIPRKQCAYGDTGLNYTFSGVTLPAQPWPKFLAGIREKICELTGYRFNFVLINRYNDGDDYMGEHRDDERDLELLAPIASLSLGRTRDFVFRHSSVKRKQTRPAGNTDNIKIELMNGSLLLMNYPTNLHWYHSLPKRKNLPGVRINMTFRVMKVKGKSSISMK